MSRVTIDKIQHDASGLDNMSWAEITKLYDIEVVPRKIVEMIIAQCRVHEQMECWSPEGTDWIRAEARDIREYAESLLKQFEEE